MKLLGILFLLCVLTMPVLAQDHCRIMFYNVENLFDTADDPSTADDEFTPRGKKHWTKAKYTDKLLKIAEVIDSVGDKELPCIVGLAEVENRWVLFIRILPTAGVSMLLCFTGKIVSNF